MIILRRPIPGISEPALSRFLNRARRAAGVRGSVTVLVTTSDELRSLNRRFRNKNKPTDVLSFPSSFEVRDYAGDLAISSTIARENARRLGHSFEEELKILVLHGLLHLAGHDHEMDSGRMARLERSLRLRLRLPVGLIERTTRPRSAAAPRRRAAKAQPAATRGKRQTR